MKNVLYFIMGITIISMFVIDILYYQQPTGRIAVLILAVIGLTSWMILMYLEDNEKTKEDEEL